MIALLAAATLAVSGPSFAISGDRNAGGIRLGMKPAQVRALLGAPTTTRAADRFHCSMTWRRWGVRVRFLTFQSRPCKRGDVLAVVAYDKRWHTSRNLFVGAPEAAVKAHHPRARLHRTGGRREWWIVTHKGCELAGPHPPPYGSLVARIRSGRVSALVVQTIACE